MKIVFSICFAGSCYRGSAPQAARVAPPSSVPGNLPSGSQHEAALSSELCLTASVLYLDLFCAKSGINRRYVQRWLPIVAASQSVKALPEEKELLCKWINVFDYE